MLKFQLQAYIFNILHVHVVALHSIPFVLIFCVIGLGNPPYWVKIVVFMSNNPFSVTVYRGLYKDGENPSFRATYSLHSCHVQSSLLRELIKICMCNLCRYCCTSIHLLSFLGIKQEAALVINDLLVDDLYNHFELLHFQFTCSIWKCHKRAQQQLQAIFSWVWYSHEHSVLASKQIMQSIQNMANSQLFINHASDSIFTRNPMRRISQI